jgi:hypothetical protein
MPVMALGLFLVWVLLAGVGRIWWQRQLTGDSGLRFSGGRLGSAQWWANRHSKMRMCGEDHRADLRWTGPLVWPAS